jgi:hypothetical protein
MNVLILTPDRVGSTLLQRLITIQANINEKKIIILLLTKSVKNPTGIEKIVPKRNIE